MKNKKRVFFGITLVQCAASCYSLFFCQDSLFLGKWASKKIHLPVIDCNHVTPNMTCKRTISYHYRNSGPNVYVLHSPSRFKTVIPKECCCCCQVFAFWFQAISRKFGYLLCEIKGFPFWSFACLQWFIMIISSPWSRRKQPIFLHFDVCKLGMNTFFLF